MNKLAFIFPGQGSQYVGMGINCPQASRYFAIASEILGYDLQDLCFSGPKEKLNQTVYTQPAVLTLSAAIWASLADNGIQPQFVAGHSLGEYTALMAAGVISFEDALLLVQKRAQYMQDAAPEGKGAMAAVIGLSRKQVLEICSPVQVEAANFNCPKQIVISGERTAVIKAIKQAKDKGAKLVSLLPVSIPSHCSLMRKVGDKIAYELDKLTFNAASIPIISNVGAKPVQASADIKDALIKQVYSSVYWEDSIRYMIAQGVDTFIELGPGNVLCRLLRRIDRKIRTLNVEDEKSRQAALDILAGTY